MNAFARILPLLVSGLLAAAPALAQRTGYFRGVPGPNTLDRSASARANAATVGILGGQLNGTTLRFAADLANVLDDGDHLRILPIIGRGGYESAEDLLYLHGVDVAILPSDLFGYYKREHLHPGAEQTIHYIAKLYDQELHILARPGIKTLDELANQTVSTDLAGTATSITAKVMFTALNIPAKLTNDSTDTALDKLRRGEIAAMMFLAGKPISLFTKLPAPANGQEGPHFLAVPATPALMESYLPARLDHASYPNLVPDGAAVDTIAVGAVMAAYAWPAGTERATKVRTFVDAFFTKFAKLQVPPSHPRWNDVNLSAKVSGWTRLTAASEALQRATLAQAKP